jgi:hypothetical protein
MGYSAQATSLQPEIDLHRQHRLLLQLLLDYFLEKIEPEYEGYAASDMG